jgi:hypothetical protein
MVQKLLLLWFVIFLTLIGCKIDRNKHVDRDKFTFKTTDDSFLFFKNVRQIYYDFQDLPKARWYAYRYGDRITNEPRPILTPVIVVDWIKNESYLLVEPNEVLSSEPLLTVRETNVKGTVFEYSLRERGRENMLEFATKIYEGIMDENTITILFEGEFRPLFSGEEDRENFRVVMSDYYRLTNVF